MAEAELRQTAYILIHERTPGMPILYASSSIKQALLYEPSELVGVSPVEFLADAQDIGDIREAYGHATDDNVIMTRVFLQSKNNKPVLTCTIAFTSSNISFHMAKSYPNIVPSRGVTVQRFKCILSSQETTGGTMSSDIHETYSTKATYQACIALDRASPSSDSGNGNNDTGPSVIFATDSINRMLDVDSCDLQGLPFLSLVAADDKKKTSELVEKAMHSDELVLERLRLLVSPLEDSDLGNPRTVAVEIMAMGSNDGTIVLCQLEGPAMQNHSSGCISLEDIVSTDPETTDFPDEWNRVSRAQEGACAMLEEA